MLTVQDTLNLVDFAAATTDDVDDIVCLYEEFFAISDLPDLGLTFSRANARQWVENVITSGSCPHIIARAPNGGLIGSIGYCMDRSAAQPFAFLDKFYVNSGWRLSAVGRVLLNLAMEAAKADGAIAFRAGLSAGAQHSKNLFLKMGFHETLGSVLMARRL